MQNVEREVSVRTRDDHAVIQDLPKGGRRAGCAWPILPTFDALSYFRVENVANPRDLLESCVKDVQPLTFADPLTRLQAHGSDAVVISLRYYKAEYAADSSDDPNGKEHIVLAPLATLTSNNNSDFYLHDLYVENRTNLPTQVTYTGRDDRLFQVDYASIDGHRVINHAHWEQTAFGPMRLGRVHFIIDATFSDFRFPSGAPDPSLALRGWSPLALEPFLGGPNQVFTPGGTTL